MRTRHKGKSQNKGSGRAKQVFPPNVRSHCPALFIVASCRGFLIQRALSVASAASPLASLMASRPCKAAPLPQRLRAHKLANMHAQHSKPPTSKPPPTTTTNPLRSTATHLVPLSYTRSSQAYRVCLCCCCRANEQCTKTKERAELLLSDPL